MRACECGCGELVGQPRGGSRPKRFASGACRARFNRRRSAAGPAAEKPPSTSAPRVEKLEELYRLLAEDVRVAGTSVVVANGAVRLNPAVGELRRVIADLERMAERRTAVWSPPVPESEVVADGGDVAGVLRAVS